jgi:hypothetical protein
MSAQTTIETVKQERHAVFVDLCGYAYCATCYHAGIPAFPCERADVPDDQECDHCESDLRLSVEIVTGSAIVEYPPCKIF